jgi:hypothetical protein
MRRSRQLRCPSGGHTLPTETKFRRQLRSQTEFGNEEESPPQRRRGAPPFNLNVHHVRAAPTSSARRFRPCNVRWIVMMTKSEK